MKTKKQKVKQQIVAVVITAFMFVMISGCYNVGNLFAATGVNVVMIQNLVAGLLNIDSMATLAFNDLNIGTAGNSWANLQVVNVQDWRGNGSGWQVYAYCNSLMVASTGVNNIANSSIFINTGTLSAVNGSTTGMGTTGAASWRALSGNLVLINMAAASNLGMGSYNLANTLVNVVYNGRGDQKAGQYQALLTLTVLAQ
jgi:hypothetical protein